MTEQEFSLRTARAAAEAGDLERWVIEFLASTGSDNADLADQLADESLAWTGPIRLPLNDLHRLAGPEGGPVLVEVDEDDWRGDVHEMKEKVDEGWEPPPVVVVERNGQLVLEDGNHRVESLRQAGETEAWAVVGSNDHAERAVPGSDHPGPPSTRSANERGLS